MFYALFRVPRLLTQRRRTTTTHGGRGEDGSCVAHAWIKKAGWADPRERRKGENRRKGARRRRACVGLRKKEIKKRERARLGHTIPLFLQNK